MSTASELKIIVAIHKSFHLTEKSGYLPLHVGAALIPENLGFQRDDQDDNISEKNDLYCELTALYWAWKNLRADALGLVHYRRYFSYPSRSFPWVDRWERIASRDELAQLLQKTPVLLPKKRHYVIESREGQFTHAHGRDALDVLRLALRNHFPLYLPAFERSMKRTSGHCFNMFVMRRDLCDAYCEWLFDTLFEAERIMRATMPDKITPRLFGYLSERMLDCWIETNSYRYIELPVVYMEKQNWLKKRTAFLMRRFGINERGHQ